MRERRSMPQNTRLVRYREELSLSAHALSELLDIGHETYMKYESMKLSPVTITGQWRESARLLAEFHGFDAAELWPELSVGVQRRIRAKLLHESTFPSAEDARIGRELEIQTERAIGTLNHNQQEVLRRRFGLSGHSEHVFREIGDHLGVCKSRASAIMYTALGELRRFDAAMILCEFTR